MSNRKPKRTRRNNLKKFDQAILTDATKVDRFTWRVNGLRISLNPTKGYFVSKDYTSMVKDLDALKELESALIEKAMKSSAEAVPEEQEGQAKESL